MRDLAQAGPVGAKRFGKVRLFIFLGFILAAGVALSFVGVDSGSSRGAGGSVVSDAPPDMKPVVLSGESGVAAGGVELKSQTAKMSDLMYGGDARATVTRSFGAGVYKLEVDATLPDPKN